METVRRRMLWTKDKKDSPTNCFLALIQLNFLEKQLRKEQFLPTTT